MSADSFAWDFIPLQDYEVPAAPASETARGRLMRLWRRLRASREGSDDGEPGEWGRPPDDLADALTPRPDWARAAESLGAALDGRWERRGAAAFVAVVGPPGAGVCPALSEVAAARGWPTLEPPSRDALLESPEALDAMARGVDSARGPVVLCPLERFYLRHESGLEPLRRLLARLAEAGTPAVLGSDSWGWAYLCRAAGVGDLTGEPLVPRPLAARDLEAWLGAPLRSRGVGLRALHGGETVLARAGESGAAAGGSAAPQRKVSPLLERLATVARGNPGVARALWRRALRTRGGGPPEAAGGEGGGPAVWIETDLEAGLPRLPERPAPEDRLVLHALLLHAGLSRRRLAALLPLSAQAVAGSVERLLSLGVLETPGDLGVSLAAYPEVRRDLAAEGFLVDGF